MKKSLLRSSAIYLVTAALFCGVFYFVAEFRIPQSVVLALVISSLTLNVKNREAKPSLRFSPYYVSVSPKWYEILTDYKLLNSAEEWAALQHSLEEVPSSEFRVLREDFFFTVVHQSHDFEKTLFFVNRGSRFVSEVDFQEPIDPIKIDRKICAPVFGECYKPDFFMKYGGNGYKLGIRVPREWWAKVKDGCPKPLGEDVDYPCGQVNIVLATLPYREFDCYWNPLEWDDGFNKSIESRTSEHRKRFEWTEPERRNDPELAINWPTSIRHKYFAVDHREV